MADPDASGLMRFANVFVIVALVAMLIGAIFIISARDPFVVDLEPGDTEVLLDAPAPEWDSLGRTLRVVLHGPVNATIHVGGEPPLAPQGRVTVWIQETTEGAADAEPEQVNLSIGQRATWRHDMQPGERWVVEVANGWEEDVRVAGTVSSTSAYATGGFLVGIGVLGFISYRVGIRRAT